MQTGHISHAPQPDEARGCGISRPVCRPRSLLNSQSGVKRPDSSLGAGSMLTLMDWGRADMICWCCAPTRFAGGVPSDLAAPMLCQLFTILMITSGWKYTKEESHLV